VEERFKEREEDVSDEVMGGGAGWVAMNDSSGEGLCGGG